MRNHKIEDVDLTVSDCTAVYVELAFTNNLSNQNYNITLSDIGSVEWPFKTDNLDTVPTNKALTLNFDHVYIQEFKILGTLYGHQNIAVNIVHSVITSLLMKTPEVKHANVLLNIQNCQIEKVLYERQFTRNLKVQGRAISTKINDRNERDILTTGKVRVFDVSDVLIKTNGTIGWNPNGVFSSPKSRTSNQQPDIVYPKRNRSQLVKLPFPSTRKPDRKTPGKVEIRIHGSQIHTWSSNSTKLKDIDKIELSNNEIGDFQENAITVFKSSQLSSPNISIEIVNNVINETSKHFINIAYVGVTLFITNNYFTDLRKDAFAGVCEVNVFYFTGNHIHVSRQGSLYFGGVTCGENYVKHTKVVRNNSFHCDCKNLNWLFDSYKRVEELLPRVRKDYTDIIQTSLCETHQHEESHQTHEHEEIVTMEKFKEKLSNDSNFCSTTEDKNQRSRPFWNALSSGGKLGIIVGIVLMFLLLVVVIIFLAVRKRKRKPGRVIILPLNEARPVTFMEHSEHLQENDSPNRNSKHGMFFKVAYDDPKALPKHEYEDVEFLDPSQPDLQLSSHPIRKANSETGWVDASHEFK